MERLVSFLSMAALGAGLFAPPCAAQSRAAEAARPTPQALMMGNSAGVMTNFFSGGGADVAVVAGVVSLSGRLPVEDRAPLAPAIQAGAEAVMSSEIPGVKSEELAAKLAVLTHPVLRLLLPNSQRMSINEIARRREGEIAPHRERLEHILKDVAEQLEWHELRFPMHDAVEYYTPGFDSPAYWIVRKRPSSFLSPAAVEKIRVKPARAAKPRIFKASRPVRTPARPTPQALMAAKSAVVMAGFFSAEAPDVASVAGVMGIAGKLSAAELKPLLPAVQDGAVGVMRAEIPGVKSDVVAAKLAVLTQPVVLRLLTVSQRLPIRAMVRRRKSEIAPYRKRLKAILKDAADRIDRHPSEFKPPVLIKS